jgi:hypothetical protein
VTVAWPAPLKTLKLPGSQQPVSSSALLALSPETFTRLKYNGPPKGLL